MVSADKLIKVGVKYSDQYFEQLKELYIRAYNNNMSFEEFLDETSDYSIGNPMDAGGFNETLTNLVASSINDIRFSRPAQKALMNNIIRQTTGELITNVGEDIKAGVRDIVKRGYNTGTLSHRNVAKEIESTLDGINHKRARTIARTEIKRAQTTSNYIVAKERGANAYKYKCGAKPCDICKKDCGKTYPITDLEHLPPRHPNCYLPDTEVYTNNGWKYFTDITVDDKILSLNPDDGSIQFLDYVKVIETENVYGYMYHIHNKWFDICVTPDHDCFIHQRRDGGKHGRYMEPQFRKPSELNSESKFLRCISTDRENPETINVNGLEFKPEDYAFFMAWYISEGSVLHNPDTAKTHGYPVKITQEIGENREVIQPVLERISDYLGLRLSIGKYGFEFYSKQLHDYLVKLGYSHEKYIPSEVFTLNKECLNIFLDNYVLGDGHERNCSRFNSSERVVFTSSPRLRDDLSYLILLCGYCPSIYVHTEANRRVTHSNGVYTTKRPVYGVRINRTQYTNFSGCTVDEIPYTGKVVCVELPEWHTLWIKRNGKTSWNGNCMCGVTFFKDPNLPDAEPTPGEEPTTNNSNPNADKIKALEDANKELESLINKWKSKGNTRMAATFEKELARNQQELDKLKNPTKSKSSQKRGSTPNDDVINNILADVLKDVGLAEKAPARKSINPNVKIAKNIETTHESNLWEKLAKKYDLELVEASKTRVTFYDEKFETPIQCNIRKNGKWIDYTNQNTKKINIEDILESYKSASDIQKKATPIMKLEGKSTDQGCVLISRDTFELNLYEGAFYKMEDSINGGNVKGAMHHEMWHCVDIRMTDEDAARIQYALNSNMKGSKYKTDVTADRRARKKTGGQQFVSSYARQSGGRNNVYEDFAESGSVMSSDTFLIVDKKGGYGKLTKEEFMEQYPNRARHFQDLMDNGELLW